MRVIKDFGLLLLAAVVGLAFSPSAVEAQRAFYVSPKGRPGGDGSKARPWDLQTALYGGRPNGNSQAPALIRPGSTIYLTAGRYYGAFECTLEGLPNAKIQIRPRPGDLAILDGYARTTLAAPLNSTSRTVILRDPLMFRPSQGILLHSPQDPMNYRLNESIQLGERRRFVTGGAAFADCIRGEPPRAFPAGTVVSPVRPTLHISGKHVVLRDLEFAYSGTHKVFPHFVRDNQPTLKPTGGVFVGGDGVQILNCIMHDGEFGVFLHANAKNTLMSGLIAFNNGYVDSNRGNGHGLYIQNRGPAPKTFRNIISFHNFATGMKAFGEQGYANNIRFERIIAFENGEAAAYPGSPALTEKGGMGNVFLGHRLPNILIGTAVNEPRDDAIVGCVSYNVFSAKGGGMGFGYLSPKPSEGMVFEGNQQYGEYFGASNVASLRARNNVFIGAEVLTGVVMPPQAKYSNWSFNNNQYYDISPPKECADGRKRHPVFQLRGAKAACSGRDALTFDEWRETTGFDKDSTYRQGLPGQPRVTVYPVPDSQESRFQFHVAIFNPKRLDAVPVDLTPAGLAVGDRFELYDVQKLSGKPVLAGAHQGPGSPIKVPVNQTEIDPILGHAAAGQPKHTTAEFAVFVGRKLPPAPQPKSGG